MKSLFTLLISILIFSNVHGQFYRQQVRNSTNIPALQNFTQRQQQQFRLSYDKALELARKNGWPVRKITEDGRLIQLVRVNENGIPIYLITHNAVSAATIKTSDVQAGVGTGYMLTGAGIEIGEWDGGEILLGHEQFTGRVSWVDTASPGLSDHSTHVCGTMIGDGTGDAAAKGMAPSGTVKAYDFTGDIAEMSAEAMFGMILSNHSYGFLAGWHEDGAGFHWFGDTTLSTTESNLFGWYNATASDYDTIAWLAPYYTIVVSAGNDRNDSITTPGGPHSHNYDSIVHTDVHPKDGNGGTGFDCLPLSANAKNILLVGAVDDLPSGYTSAGAVSPAPFSSWGPTDDGRIKPDIVANGVILKSASSAGPSSYAFKSGTSMSAPSVTGSIALLQELYAIKTGGEVMKSATVKALLVNTADEAGPAEGPDYMFGWGLMNTLKAAEAIAADSLNPEIIREDSLLASDSVVFEFYASGDGPVNATLCWTDVPATATSAGLDVLTPKLVNDLDMVIYDPAMMAHFPYKLDPSSPDAAATVGDNDVDNVEKITMPMVGCGQYRLVIKHEGPLTGASQQFSLIITGIEKTPAVAEDAGIFSISGFQALTCDSFVRPELIIKNYGLDTLHSATVYYSLNGAPPDSFEFTGLLTSYCSQDVNLLPMYLSSGSGQEFKAWTSMPNGSTDSILSNDTISVSFDIMPSPDSVYAFPYYEDFNGAFPPADWTILNPDGSITWDTLHTHTCPGKDTSLYFNFYDYGPGKVGEKDTIISPLIDLRMANHAVLSFDVSYAIFVGGAADALEVIVSDNCGYEYTPQYFKAAMHLASAPPAFPKYIPPGCMFWRKDFIDLSMFRGKVIRIAFVGINGFGNSLYIDNIAIEGESCPAYAPAVSPHGSFDFCGSVAMEMSSTGFPPGQGYQWFNHGQPIPGVIDSIYTARDSGIYTYTHTGVCQYPVSDADTITVFTPTVSGLAAKGDSGSCYSFSLDDDLTITDGSGDALLSINDNGQDLGRVTVRTYDHGATSPVFNGEHYLERSFEIISEEAPSTSIEVTLYFDSTEFRHLRDSSADISGLSDLMVTQCTSGTLGDPSSGFPTAITSVSIDSAGGPDGAHSITFSISSFSTFFIHSNSEMDPLPVELLNFEAKWEAPGKKALITWHTASEFNNSHFEIQRSTDLKNWEALGHLAGQGTSNHPASYSFTDSDFENLSTGVTQLYYRLMQVDFENHSTYSPIRVLDLNKNSTFEMVTVFPNPTKDLLNIHPTNPNENIKIQLTDGTGRIILSQMIIGITEINTQNLPEGIYFLQLQGSYGGLHTQKVMILK